LGLELNSIKYYTSINDDPITFDFDYNTYLNNFDRLFRFLLQYIGLDFYPELNNFYISENKETLYIIENECLGMFNIKNKEILSILDKLPYILHNSGNITLNNNILYPNSKITKNINNYKSSNDIQIFKFNGNDLSIDFNEKNKDTYFTLDGNIEDWYYINTLLVDATPITQLVYISFEDSKKFNDLFLKYKTPFKFDLHCIYKFLYNFKDDNNNPNRGFKCIYKNILKTTTEENETNLFTILTTRKIVNMCYCKAGNDSEKIRYHPINTNKFYDYIDYFFNYILDIYIQNTIDYNKLYISEDETTLYYIEDDYIDNFNVLNRNVLDNMPNIEYSKEISTKNNSDYYTITLNNNLSSTEIANISFFQKNLSKFICKYDVQIFNLVDETVVYSKEEDTAVPVFELKGDINNWYFILTTLKTGVQINKSVDFLAIKKLNDGKKILQLIYITPDIIEKYNKMFIDLRIPISFIRIPIYQKKQLKPLPAPIVSSIKGGNKKTRKLLKTY